MIVSNAIPLLHLARAGLLDLLPKLYAKVIVPPSAWSEVAGRAERRPESHVLHEASETWVEVKPLSGRERTRSDASRRGAPVGRGEADAIALAEALRVAVLMDDRVGIDLARMRGIETRWTTSVVLEAYGGKILDRRAARRAIQDLVTPGLWIRQDVLLRILEVLTEE